MKNDQRGDYSGFETIVIRRLHFRKYIANNHRRDIGWCRCLLGRPQERASFVAGAVLGGGAGLLFVSGTDEPARQPGAHVSRCRGRRYDVLHLHDTASLLVGRGIQPSRNRQHGASDSSPQKASKRSQKTKEGQ